MLQQSKINGKIRNIKLLVNKFYSLQDDEMERLLEKIEVLEILVKGCRVHPAYRAIRPATGRCLPCVKMWKARQKLNNLIEKEEE